MNNGTFRPVQVVLTVFLSACCAVSVMGAQQSSSAGDQAPTSQERVRNVDEWNLAKKTHLAIKGYDPVAYFPEGGGSPSKGKSKFEVDHNGVTYRFSSSDNLKRFKEDPARYEPAYGGWCAWAMRDGDKVEVDVKSFLVRENRLFLFYNGWLGDTRAKWVDGDHEQYCDDSDAQWLATSGETPQASGDSHGGEENSDA